ncbi:putative transporter [Bisporella sp. PMI_857]|nr:putative transporter [Bisporella sp. PMI_857]
MALKTVFTESPFARYVRAIKDSPPGIYNRRLFFSVFVYALGGIPKTWDEGSAASVPSLPGFQQAFGITSAKNPQAVSNFISFVNITCGLAAFFSFFVNDRIGRLWSLRLYLTIYTAGCLVSTFSYGHIGVLYLGRLIAGIGIGPLTVTGPMSIVEIAPVETRGLLTLWFGIVLLASQTIGVFTVYACYMHVAPSHLQYQITFFAQTFAPVIVIILSFFATESPRWLCLVGRQEAAFETLVRLRGLSRDHPLLLKEWNEFKTQIIEEQTLYGEQNWKSILRETFCVTANLRRVQLTCVTYGLAQLSGGNAVTSYLPGIFKLIGIHGTSTSIMMAAFYAFAKMVFIIIASLFLVDALGRRRSLLIGITIQMLSHIHLGVYLKFYMEDASNVNIASSRTAFAAIYIHGFGWSIGLLILPYLFGAELWPNRIRSFGGSLSQAWHWLFYFVIVKATPFILSSMRGWGAFIFFAAWCLIALVYTYILVPETSGLVLEHIDALFEGPWYLMRKKANQLQKNAIVSIEIR